MTFTKQYLYLMILLCSLGSSRDLYAQELFVFSEPASNMAAKGIGLRLTSMPMKNDISKKIDNYSNVEFMVGLSKKLMLHNEIYFSNIAGNSKIIGTGFYGKYRLYTKDAVHRHFRVAALGRVTILDGIMARAPINLTAKNSGAELGMVATQLINKYAFSAGVSYLRGWDNGKYKFQNASLNRDALAYNLALGKLVLPKEYVGYDQLNVNVMLEGLGQVNPVTGQHIFDVAPSLQFIIASKMRIDAGYRFRVLDDYSSIYKRSFLLRLEYNWFNVL